MRATFHIFMNIQYPLIHTTHTLLELTVNHRPRKGHLDEKYLVLYDYIILFQITLLIADIYPGRIKCRAERCALDDTMISELRARYQGIKVIMFNVGCRI